MAVNIVFNKFNKIHRNACATLVINLTHAGWTSNINLGNIPANDIESDKIQAFFQ